MATQSLSSFSETTQPPPIRFQIGEPTTVTWTHKGVYVFDFHNFHDLALGKDHSSPHFKFGGHEWSLSLKKKAGQRTTTFLTLNHHGEKSEATAVFSFGFGHCYSSHTFSKSFIDEGRFRFRPQELGPSFEKDTASIHLELRVMQLQKGLKPFEVRDSWISDLEKMIKNSQNIVRFKVESQIFVLPREMLAIRAPELASIVDDYDGISDVIELNGVSAGSFDVLAKFVDGSQRSIPFEKHAAQDVFKVADLFGAQGLRTMAEVQMAKAVNGSNIVDMLLFADSHSCALLKEESITYIIENRDQVPLPKLLDELQDSPQLAIEVIKIISISEEQGEQTPIRELYTKLQDLCLPLDGTKRMLEDRLRNALVKNSNGQPDSTIS